MPDKIRTSFLLDTDLQAGLRQLKERDGVPPAESIRRAIAAYLVEKGIKPKSTKSTKGPKR